MKIMQFIFFREPYRLRSGWKLLILIVGLVIILVLMNFILHSGGIPKLIEDGSARPLSLLLVAVIWLGSVLFVIWLIMRFLDHRSLATVGLPLHGPWIKGMGTGFLLGAFPVVMMVITVWIVGSVEFERVVITEKTILNMMVPVIVSLFLLSAGEELILRGYMMQLLTEGAGRWTAVMVIGIVFGLLHTGNPGANPLGMLNTVVNASLLSWLVMRTGSLWIAWGYHAGWNICGAVLFGMRLSGVDFPGAFVISKLTGPEWVSGGEYGFEGSAVAGVAEFIILVIALVVALRLPGHPEIRLFYSQQIHQGKYWKI